MNALSRLLAAIAFYTCLPIPFAAKLDFRYVAQLAPLIGMMIGSSLVMLDIVLQALGMPVLTRSVLLVLSSLGITGGLHLDGVMDTADGLAVQDPQRRLAVMSDSATGAFGSMAAIAILLLKSVALSDLGEVRAIALILAPGWGRWAQQVAIARYPYLKPSGKGAFHKAAIPSLWHTMPSLALLVGVSLTPLSQSLYNWRPGLTMLCVGIFLAIAIPAWFHRQLGGHTGDTYGAVVEWTETLFLTVLTIL